MTNENSPVFFAIKSFIIDFVLANSTTEYTPQSIEISYQRYTPVDGENNSIIMNLLSSIQPEIQDENYTYYDEITKEFSQIWLHQTTYFLQIDFLGIYGYATANKFRNALNTITACHWFQRKHNLVVLTGEMVNNQTETIDQQAYVPKFSIQCKLQGSEIVQMPLNKYDNVGVALQTVNY